MMTYAVIPDCKKCNLSLVSLTLSLSLSSLLLSLTRLSRSPSTWETGITSRYLCKQPLLMSYPILVLVPLYFFCRLLYHYNPSFLSTAKGIVLFIPTYINYTTIVLFQQQQRSRKIIKRYACGQYCRS
jgi:hypothetical protein